MHKKILHIEQKNSLWKDMIMQHSCACALIHFLNLILLIHMSKTLRKHHVFDWLWFNVSHQHNKESLVSGALSSRLLCNKTWIKRIQGFLKHHPRFLSALEQGTHTWFYYVASPLALSSKGPSKGWSPQASGKLTSDVS